MSFHYLNISKKDWLSITSIDIGSLFGFHPSIKFRRTLLCAASTILWAITLFPSTKKATSHNFFLQNSLKRSSGMDFSTLGFSISPKHCNEHIVFIIPNRILILIPYKFSKLIRSAFYENLKHSWWYPSIRMATDKTELPKCDLSLCANGME